MSLNKKDFGKYTIEQELGKGGMAIVYLAVHRDLGRRVALKVMHPHLATDKDARIRFEMEARAIARLEHTNILQIYDFGSHDDNFYIAMELIDGHDAEKILKDNGPFPAEIAAVVFGGIASGLHQAHQHGIIHRDIKLSNVIVKNDGVAKLSDFGIVKMEDAASLTSPDSLVGTPYYISPEQVDGSKSSVRSDIYALGVTLYYALTGGYPFKAETLPLVLSAISSGKYKPLRECPTFVPADLAVIVEKCMNRNPDHRYENAQLIAQDLNSFLYRRQAANDSSMVVQYLKNPGTFSQELKAASIRLKFERAKTYKDKDMIFEALQEFESILQEDPDNAEVRAEITKLGEVKLSRSRTHIDMQTLVVPRKSGLSWRMPLLATVLVLTLCATIYFTLRKAGPAPVADHGSSWRDSVFQKDTVPVPAASKPAAIPPAPAPLSAPPVRSAKPVKPALVPTLASTSTSAFASASKPADSVSSAPAPAAEPAPKPAAVCTGFLFAFTELWGTIYLDGAKTGNAPTKTKIAVPCGTYAMRIESPAGKVYEAPVTILPDETLRLQIKEAEFQ